MNKTVVSIVTVLLFLLLVTALLVYGHFAEPARIRVRHVTIYDNELFNAWGRVRLAHISDLHVTDMGKVERILLERLEAVKPDMIFVTGDMAQWNSSPSGALEFISKLHAPGGVYCVMGDADYSSRRYHCLFCHPGGNVHIQRRSPRILRNATATARLPSGKKMLVAGVSLYDDWGGESGFPENILGTEGPPVLVLSHFGGKWSDAPDVRAQLWLSGDTHGGQIWLPGFMWKLLRLKPDPDHMYGLFKSGKHKWLYVNPGIGMTEGVPFRIGVPPEITGLTFGNEHGGDAG